LDSCGIIAETQVRIYLCRRKIMLKVLYVDDKWQWLFLVKGALEGTGYEVTSFNSLEAAKQAEASGGFDILVVDGRISVPGDGIAWAEQLHQAGKKVIILTSSNLDGSNVPYFDKGDFKLENIGPFLKKLAGL
jgi:CheY-like chemotaxis protein